MLISGWLAVNMDGRQLVNDENGCHSIEAENKKLSPILISEYVVNRNVPGILTCLKTTFSMQF
jgi:hypothetical protein